MKRLSNKKIAILVADLTHDEEYAFPRYWLLYEGAKVVTVGLYDKHISRFNREIKVDITIDKIKSEEFDAVIIPGGFGPDKLRINENVLNFIRYMDRHKKLIAAICHGPQVLISAGIVKNRRMTCVKQVAVDLVNAGAKYVDEPAVVDGNIITSRNPYDLPAFTMAIIEYLSSRE